MRRSDGCTSAFSPFPNYGEPLQVVVHSIHTGMAPLFLALSFVVLVFARLSSRSIDIPAPPFPGIEKLRSKHLKSL